MAALGQYNTLRIVREASPGLYLDGEEFGEVLLPRRYLRPDLKLGGEIDVILYLDSEERPVATTETALATVGQFACLQVVSASPKLGAFLDWGLSKDLLLPIREQARRVAPGEWVVAYIFIDEKTGRIVASTRLDRHLQQTPPPYTEGQRVQLLITGETPLGYNAIVEGTHWGLLYRSEVGVPLVPGQQLEGYVRSIRPDGKIDLRLDPAGYERVAPLTQRILNALAANGGRLEFDDTSSPAAIRTAFATSKKAFKQALGALLRQGRIRFEKGGIQSLPPAKKPA